MADLNGISVTGSLAQRPELADALWNYRPDQISYAWSKVFAPMPVDTKSGELEVVTAASILTDSTGIERNPGGEFAQSSIAVELINYSCVSVGEEFFIPTDLGTTVQLNKELAAMRKLRGNFDRYMELKLANAMDSSALLDSTASGGWSSSDAEIIADVQNAIAAVKGATGTNPDTLLVGYQDLLNMTKNSEILAHFPNSVMLTQQMIAANVAPIFGLNKLVVSDAVDSTLTPFISGKALVACTANEGADQSEISLGRTLFWAADGDPNLPFNVISYYFAPRKSNVYQWSGNVLLKEFDGSFGCVFTTT